MLLCNKRFCCVDMHMKCSPCTNNSMKHGAWMDHHDCTWNMEHAMDCIHKMQRFQYSMSNIAHLLCILACRISHYIWHAFWAYISITNWPKLGIRCQIGMHFASYYFIIHCIHVQHDVHYIVLWWSTSNDVLNLI